MSATQQRVSRTSQLPVADAGHFAAQCSVAQRGPGQHAMRTEVSQTLLLKDPWRERRNAVHVVRGAQWDPFGSRVETEDTAPREDEVLSVLAERVEDRADGASVLLASQRTYVMNGGMATVTAPSDSCTGNYTVTSSTAAMATLMCMPLTSAGSPVHTDTETLTLSDGGTTVTYAYNFGSGSATQTVTRLCP